MILAKLRTYKTRTPAGGLVHLMRVRVANESIGPLDVLLGIVPAQKPGHLRQYLVIRQKGDGLLLARVLDTPQGARV